LLVQLTTASAHQGAEVSRSPLRRRRILRAEPWLWCRCSQTHCSSQSSRFR